MKAAAFRYHRATSLDDALAVMADDDEEVRALAGGQSLVPLMAMRLSRPEVLVDLNGVDALAGVALDGGHLRIGAMTRQRDVERSPLVAEHLPLLRTAIGHIGHVTIRHRGTIGGSVAHADPAAELPAAVVALGAEMVLASTGGTRVVPAEEFFDSYLVTAVEPGELLVEVRFPLGAVPARHGMAEFTRRAGDFAVAGAIVLADVAADLTVRRARVVPMAVDPAPRRSARAEELLVGRALDDGVIREVAAAVAAGCGPVDDIHGSAAYRRDLVAEMTRRALARLRQGAGE
ncbi:molybdopterin dehydrogenase [Streptosporangium violaceochromogenes]|nr:molybdopterin dehydrogenase [Streptosporangium violaceochromogenes]